MNANVTRDGRESKVLLVDDDDALTGALTRSLARHGLQAIAADSARAALAAAAELRPACAVVDLRLPDRTGLQLVAELIARHPDMRVIILTGHASIPSAVEAIKLGAVDYLVKPVYAEEIVVALRRGGADPDLPITAKPMSVNRVEWEHINRVLYEHGGNVSATARALSLHRRTLQRKLAKHPARA